MLQQAICNGKRRYCKAAAAQKQFGGGSRVWESRSRKNIAHHGWPTENSLGFEFLKTDQMPLKFLLGVLLVCQNNFTNPFLFTRAFS